MDIFDKVGNILDNIELILDGLILIIFIWFLFASGIEKFGIKGLFITLVMLIALIGFGFLVYDLTQGQSFLIQALAEFIVVITFYFILKAFLKGTL